jgi:CrcB protein
MRPKASLPTGPVIGRRMAWQRRKLSGQTWALLSVVAAGGVIGACGRNAVALAWPHRPGGFPWATFVINVSGCLLIGVLMVLITEVWSAHRLLRPFLGVGVLGGYTTFSTYAVDVQQLVVAHAARTALLYLVGTLLAALAAVYLGIAGARLVTSSRRGRRKQR